MIKLFIQSIRLTVVFTILTGVFYPLAITGVAQWAFRDKANGSLIERDGKIVGSELLAQQFQGARYFWPRPSAGNYATVPSGASNLGPTSAALQSNVAARAAAIRAANKLPADASVPADLLFTSGSGLDPHISPEAARLQVDPRRHSARRQRGVDQDAGREIHRAAAVRFSRRTAGQRFVAESGARPADTESHD